METGKEIKKKINILEAMHYIMAAWQQVSQQTIQNCSVKPGTSTSRMVMKWQNDDNIDFGQDWEELCRAQKYDFQR
jgi:hypothetical protein